MKIRHQLSKTSVVTFIHSRCACSGLTGSPVISSLFADVGFCFQFNICLRTFNNRNRPNRCGIIPTPVFLGVLVAREQHSGGACLYVPHLAKLPDAKNANMVRAFGFPDATERGNRAGH
jgi:hypothetical protein